MIKLNGQVVEFSHFNDGTCRIVLSPPFTPARVIWLYDNDEEIVQIMYLISHLKAHHCDVRLRMPFMPNARQDRVHSAEDVFTLKYFCRLLNSLSLDEIEIFDPHSHVCEALLDNVVVRTPSAILQNLLADVLPPDIHICYPDTGAEHKYSTMLQRPYVTGVKQRDFATGKIQSYELLGEVHDYPFLIIDDIIGKGNTVYLAAQELKAAGANDIYVYASHVENTIFQPLPCGQSLIEVPNLITKIYTTNSIYRGNNNKIEVIKYF